MILIVDDKPENLYSLRKLLELHHFQVDTSASGEDALRKVLRNHYALIILDVQMPGMDGFEVAEAITGFGKSRDIPILFLSAVKINKTFITKGYDSGGIDYVTKPFDPDVLLLKVRTFYRLSEQRRELEATHRKLREEIEFRKKAEEELSHSVEELRAVLEAIPQMACITDADGRLEYVNAYGFRQTGSREAFPRVPEGDQPVEGLLREAIGDGAQRMAELRVLTVDQQQPRYYQLTMTPVWKGGRIIRWVNIFTDIHDQKMVNHVLEQRVLERTMELNRINMQLELSNDDLQQYASVASHDLKEPLRKIQIYSDRIRRQYLQDNREAGVYLEKIISSSQRLTGLINDLLKYSRLSGEGHFEETDINALLDELLADLEILIAERQARIQIDRFPPMEVIPGQIRQLFQNMISNSVKFTRPDQPPEISISVQRVREPDFQAKEDPGGGWCRITIRDNGIGFDDRYRDKIFTMFQRLHSRDAFEGTGIGLAIVKKIIEKHRGLITVSSREGQGSAFQMLLPLRQAADPTSVPAATKQDKQHA